MKKLSYIIVILFISISFKLEAQNVVYDLRCSEDNTVYELYVTRSASAIAPFINLGSSRVTLVLPTKQVPLPTARTGTVSHTNENVGVYTALPAIYNPNATGNDYFGFSTSGGASLIDVLEAGKPELWMTFTPSGGTSQDARLFINDSDPMPTDTGMGGVDLSNTFFTLSGQGIVNEYSGNDSGIVSCSSLSDGDILLSDFKLYPNPVSNKVYLKGNLNTLKSIDLFNMKGQLVKHIENNFKEIDVSHLEAAVYFVKLYFDKGYKTIKLIKK